MATGTYTPDPFEQYNDNAGNPLVGGQLFTYMAGTTTPVATYSDVNLTVQNANPVILDSAGRPTSGAIFLTPGQSYKFVLEDSNSNVIATRDNILGTPTTSSNQDVSGTAGEALTAGQVVYLSDGSASKNAGQWYKADNTNAYSCIQTDVGLVPNAIASGATGTVRRGGSITGLVGLTVGSDYYVGTAGAITSTAPDLRRRLGRADTTSSLVIDLEVPSGSETWANDFRLTLSSGVPVPSTDVTAATTLYCTPYVGNRIDLPDANGNPVRAVSAEFSIAIPATTSQMYDIWGYLSSGVPTLELLAWTNDTTRATAIARTNGRYFKSGDVTRMYLGSFRTTAVSGQSEDSLTKRYCWNYYNRVPRPMRRLESTASWNYTTFSFQQANAAAANQLDLVVGVAEDEISVKVIGGFSNATGGASSYGAVAIGQDSTTTAATGCVFNLVSSTINGAVVGLVSVLETVPPIGRHTYVWLEEAAASGTGTFYGTNAGQTGISATWRN